jgi:hypothetical protein
MAANRATASAWTEPEPQENARSWSTAVPYDLLDQDDNMFQQPNARAAAASAPTTRLRAVPTRAAAAAPAGRARSAPRRAEMPDAHPAPVALPTAKTGRLFEAAPAANPLQGASTARMALLGAGLLAGVVVMYLVVSAVIHWTQVTMDDLAYGRPRTTHMEAIVGHNDSAEQPTKFIGLNLDRQVTVFEIPAGDANKASVINGPYLFGEGEDLTPVHLNTLDVNGDTKPDLIVSVKDEQIVYINDNGSFRAINPDEKALLEQQAAAQQK